MVEVDGRAVEMAMTSVDGVDDGGVVETCGRIGVEAEIVVVAVALVDFSPYLESASTSLGIGMF